jgi:hypothetical protein
MVKDELDAVHMREKIRDLAREGYGEETEAEHEAVFCVLVEAAQAYIEALAADLRGIDGRAANMPRAAMVEIAMAGLRENLEDEDDPRPRYPEATPLPDDTACGLCGVPRNEHDASQHPWQWVAAT